MINTNIKQAIGDARKMLKNGEPQHKILCHLINAAESLAGNHAVSSVLVLDKDGLLRNAASPGLPGDYLTAIDGLKPHPKVGTCASAAATGRMVFTSDFIADDKWAELKHLPIALGFAGAWSMPIKNTTGKILGTFGTYFREKREPSKEEIEGVQLLAQVAGQVISLSEKIVG